MGKSEIIESVIEKAQSMQEAWIPKIAKAIKEEGINLPELK